MTTIDGTDTELIQLVDEQLASDEVIRTELAQQADEIHSAYAALVARLRRETCAGEAPIPGAHRLRG